MKITTTQKELARGLAAVGHAISSQSTLPILANILLATDAGRLRLQATNLEIAITCWIEAHVHEEGSTTVPAKLTAELVGSLSHGSVDLTSDLSSHTLYIKTGRTSSTIRGLNPEEYPQSPVMEECEAPFVIEAGQFKELVRQVAFAAADNDSRPVFTGVHTQITGGKLTMAAADSFRLAVREIAMEGAGDPILIPARTLSQLSRILPTEGPVEILVTRNRDQVHFHVEGLNMSSRLIEGTFPNFRQIIPQDYVTKATVETKEFANAVNSIIPFARDSRNITRIKVTRGTEGGLEPGTVTVEATAEDVGNNVTTINAAIDGPEQSIFFNATYLADILDALNSEEMSLEITASNKPSVIRPLATVEYAYVVMPLNSTR